MSAPVSSAALHRERATVQRLAKQSPGVAVVGYQTGQLDCRRSSETDEVRRVSLTAVAAPGLGEEPMLYYHPVVHGRTEDGERVQWRERFRHSFPAHDWLMETVPDFDLVETRYVNVPEEERGDAESPASDD